MPKESRPEPTRQPHVQPPSGRQATPPTHDARHPSEPTSEAGDAGSRKPETPEPSKTPEPSETPEPATRRELLSRYFARREPPDESDPEAIQESIADMEELVLGAPRRYTSGQVARMVGISLEEARSLWRAMGFADFGPARAFTDADVEALRHLLHLMHTGLLPEPVGRQFVRSVGQTMARFAEWQTEAWVEYIGGEDGEERSEQSIRNSGVVMPELEPLIIYVWRRHLAASTTRTMETVVDTTTVGQRLAVGFADLVGFTRLSRNLGEAELGELVQTFEDAASDVITGLGGRLVKTLGDEVLFVAFSPAAAAETGLRLVEAMAAEPILPELRVGIAYGQVLSRMGDVFGTTVNLASRLTALSPKNSVVVDRELASVLSEDPSFALQPMWRRPVRGLGLVEPWTVQRPEPPAVTSVAPRPDGPTPPDPIP